MKICVVKSHHLTACLLIVITLLVDAGLDEEDIKDQINPRLSNLFMEKKVKYEANIFCLALKSVGIEVKDGGSDGFSLLELGHHAGP